MSKITVIIENKKYFDGVTLVERMKEYHTAAVSIAIIENCKLSETYTYGVKRRNRKENITIDTIFQAGSISKPVFAVGVMRLVEQGKFDLDTDIKEYVKNYNIPTYDNKEHKITLRQILAHSAGFNLHGFSGYQKGQRIPTVEQILTGAFPTNSFKLKLINEPETVYEYSGGGYILAQKAVTDACKQDFCGLMEELVLSPLGMLNSTFSQPLPKEKLNQIACGYDYYNLQLPGGYNIMPELSAAGLWATPSELALLGIEIMKALKGESTFLSKKAAEEMITKAYEKSPHGVGFVINQCQKGLTFGHRGANFGYHANMIFCPDNGTGIVIMQNSDIGAMIVDEITNSFKEVFEW